MSLWKVCLEDKDEVRSNVYLQDIYMIKNEMKPREFRTWLIIVETSYNSEHVLSNEEMKCKFQNEHLEEIICLKLAILMVIIDI